MSFNQERIAAANQAYLTTLEQTLAAPLSGVLRPAARQFHTTQAVLADVTKLLKALCGARDLQDVPLLRGTLVPPGSEPTVVYLRSLQEIAREVQQRWERIVQMQLAVLPPASLSPRAGRGQGERKSI